LTIAHTYHGNTYNVMDSLRWANTQSCATVYIVEDDCIVSPDFFKWCRAALQEHPDAFAACGWRYSPDAPVGDGPDMLLGWYLSVCAAIPKKNLPSIIQHARPEYYSDMKKYLDTAYPSSVRRGTLHYEQDGCVLRVMESLNKRCVWPRVPKGTHIGWHGYHAPGRALEGTLEESIRLIKLALRYPELLSKLMAGGPAPKIGYCNSCKTALLADSELTAVCVKCFHDKYPNLPVTSTSHYYLRSQL
jgi:hypothetical protein